MKPNDMTLFDNVGAVTKLILFELLPKLVPRPTKFTILAIAPPVKAAAVKLADEFTAGPDFDKMIDSPVPSAIEPTTSAEATPTPPKKTKLPLLSVMPAKSRTRSRLLKRVLSICNVAAALTVMLAVLSNEPLAPSNS